MPGLRKPTTATTEVGAMAPVDYLTDVSLPVATHERTHRCAVCGGPSSDMEEVESELPPVPLCAGHLAQYRSDWLMLGWCNGHYAEALKRCPVHNCVVEPL